MANEVSSSQTDMVSDCLIKENSMKPEANEVLAQAKQNLANPMQLTPDFTTMSIMNATKWCMENGIDKATDISSITGKKLNTVHTAQWKLRNPKRVKVLARRAKKARKVKIMLISDETKKAKPTTTQKPKIKNGLYDDGMETPYLDALNRQRTRYDLLERSIPTQTESELMAENRRLKILVDHYESLLFKGGK